MPPVIRLALVGDPVEHSLSPVMHRAAMRSTGLEGEYEAILADVAMLDAMVVELRQGRIHGLNVTMPLKTAAAHRCDRLTSEALMSGSVNTLRWVNDELEGHSTDVVAFTRLFERFSDIEMIHVLGSGGAARAALAAWPRPVAHFSARHPDRLVTRLETRVVPWGEGLVGALVVNATPLGMNGEALPEGVVREAFGLIDLPYGRAPTPAATRTSSDGLALVDGVEFLALQAAASFEWWTGLAVDSDGLIRAARNA